MGYVYLVIAIIGEVIATTALKSSEQFTKLWPSVIVVVGYSVAFYGLSVCLKSISIGVAYALWSSIGLIFITLLGWLVYKQTVDTPAMIGMGLIIAGVITINAFSKSVHV